MPLINKKGIESENPPTIGQWSVDRRRKGINRPKRGYCFTMERTSFGRMESFSFLYIWNQKCSIQYPVLHKYYTAWFSLVRLFSSQVWQNYLFVRKFKSEILKKLWINLKSSLPWSISITSFWGKYVFCMQTVMSLWNHYLASDIHS
jgi:hypothetical protein